MTDGRYQHAFDPNTSQGAAVRLVEASGTTEGVVLDLGCGYGAVAEPLQHLGLDYVGVDIGRDGLADLDRRGFETHVVDLLLAEPELVDRLREVVGERPLAVVLALDVLEHLLDVPATLRALRTLAGDAEVSLVVSYPNVTHFDVGAKLLLGRWDTTDEGLLDRTHTQFIAGRDLPRVFGAEGWQEVDSDDVVRDVSDQCFPSYTPLLRPGAPAHDLLRTWRDRADPSGSTFQFVRRFLAGAAVEAPVQADTDEERPFVTVLVLDDPRVPFAQGALSGDLAAQEGVADRDVVVVPNGDLRALERAFHGAAGRYVVVVSSTSRVSPDWLAGFAEVEAEVTGALLRGHGGCSNLADLHEPGRSATTLIAAATPVELHTLDPAHAGQPGPAPSGAYAVPTEVGRTMGLGLDPADGPAAWAVLLARAASTCGVQPTRRGTVLFDRDDVEPARVAAVDEVLVAALDREPLLLRSGDAGRLSAARQRLAQLEVAWALEHERRSAVEAELGTLRAHVEAFDDQLTRARAERDLWRSVAERKPSVQLRALLGRLVDRSQPG